MPGRCLARRGRGTRRSRWRPRRGNRPASGPWQASAGRRLRRLAPVSLEELLAVLVARLSHVQVLEAVDGLRRRSLIERGQRVGSFTLQSVVLEYVTSRLVTMASQEIGQGRLLRLREHGFSQAQAKEYVRQTQQRLLLAPLLP